MTELPTHVTIREVSLRDGLQIEEPIPLSRQARTAGRRRRHRRARGGGHRVRLTVEGARTRRCRGTRRRADNDSTTSSSPRWWPAPTAPNARSPRACDSIEYVVSAADGHSRANVGRSTRRGHRADRRDRRDRPRQRRHGRGDHRHRVGLPVRRARPRRSGSSTSWRARRAICGVDRLAIADTIGTTTPRPGRATLVADVRAGDRTTSRWARTSTTPAAPDLASAYAAVSAGVTRLDASVGGLGGCPFAPAPAATSPPRTWSTCLRDSGVHVDVDLQAAIDAAARRRSGSSATTCPARCCAPATGSWRLAMPAATLSPRAGRPARPSSRPPGSCSPSEAFTAPRWRTSPRPRASRRRCSTATSTTRKTCWRRWPSRSCTRSSRRRA